LLGSIATEDIETTEQEIKTSVTSVPPWPIIQISRKLSISNLKSQI
jgi:hypothetical protein